MALAAVRPSRLPAAPARVVLLLPAQQPSFECAYLAAVGVAAATSLARRPSGSPASRFLFEVKRCKQLVGNAACLLVGQCSSLVEAETSPGTSEASDSVWGGALSVSRRHSELSEVLRAGHRLLRADARPSLEATSTSSGKFTPEDRSSLMNLELSQQIRAACGDPAQLGPLVGVLSSRLRKLSSSEKGSSSDVVFFGGKSPSLISDIPLAGSLLTSASWCRRVAEALEPSDNGKCLEKLKARKLEAPLKGMDLVLFWLLQIMDDAPAQAALAACQAMALQRPGEPALAWPWEDSGADSEDADDRLMPSEFLQYLDTVRPPLGQVCADDLLTLQQQRDLAQHQEAAVLAGRPLIEAVQRGDVNQVRHLLLAGAKVDIQYHTKHHSLGLVHLAAALGISPPEGREYAKDHPASLIAADLQIQLYQVRNPSAEDGGVAILKLLVEAKCGLDIQDSDGSTPCFYAAMAGNVRCLEYILQAGGQQAFGTLDFLQRSDLYWATSNDQPHTVRWLLENVQGAKVDGQSRQGRTPLAKAAWSDLPECAQILIQNKADPRVVDDHGRTVLHMASWGPLGGRRGGKFVNGRAAGASPRCIELLLRSPEGRSCLVVGDRDLGTPLAIASATGALDAIEVIVACEEGRMQVLKHPPTAIDFVPLAAASFRGHEGCLRKLLEVLGDPSMRGKHTGRSALDFAVIGQQLSIVMLLAERLAKMTCCDGPGFANSNATPAISDVNNINNIRNMHPTDQGSLLLQSDSGCNSVSQLELVDLFVSAMRWALWTGVSPMVEALARACPPAVEAQDFLLLCLIAGPSCTPPVVWPPFPQIEPMWPPPEWSPEEVALLGPAGPLRNQPLSSGLGTRKGLSQEAFACCQSLLCARAAVYEGTLAGALRHGLGTGDGSQEQELLEGMLGRYLERETEHRAPSESLGWALVAAANAGATAALSALLSRRADPGAHGGLAITAAAAAGAVDCLTKLVGNGISQATCPAGLSFDSAVSPEQVSPVLVAASAGHNECVAKLLCSSDDPNLQQQAAEAAAEAGYLDMAHWLQTSSVATSDGVAMAAGVRAEQPTVLCFRAQTIASPEDGDTCRQGGDGFVDQACHVGILEQWSRASGRMPASRRGRVALWVDAEAEAVAALAAICRDLRTGTGMSVLGVDLECYDNVICTVQLSTQSLDVVLDGLRLHAMLGTLLREVFEDGSIVKVFHAPRNDLQWLRINFGLRIVNLFDTSTAAAHLQGSGGSGGGGQSLKALCKEFLSLDLDKTHQCSDWRLRPLPEAMLHYAASDSCVLLPLSALLAERLQATPGLLEMCSSACGRLAVRGQDNAEATRLVVELL